MDVPEVEASQEVSLKECKRASLKNEYVAGDSKILRVTPGTRCYINSSKTEVFPSTDTTPGSEVTFTPLPGSRQVPGPYADPVLLRDGNLPL